MARILTSGSTCFPTSGGQVEGKLQQSRKTSTRSTMWRESTPLTFFFQPFDKQSKAQKKFTVPFCLFRFEFSVSLVELHRRNLDVAVKNGGGLLSKHKGLLGKVQTSLIYCLYLCVTEKHFFNTMKPSEWKFSWFWEKPHFVRLCLKVQVLLFFLLLVSYFYEVHHFDCIRKRCGFVFVCRLWWNWLMIRSPRVGHNG